MWNYGTRFVEGRLDVCVLCNTYRSYTFSVFIKNRVFGDVIAPHIPSGAAGQSLKPLPFVQTRFFLQRLFCHDFSLESVETLPHAQRTDQATIAHVMLGRFVAGRAETKGLVSHANFLGKELDCRCCADSTRKPFSFRVGFHDSVIASLGSTATKLNVTHHVGIGSHFGKFARVRT